jgi:putative ABC transport system permease protein
VLFATGRGPVHSAPDLYGWQRPYPAATLAVSPQVFDVLGISIVAGRTITDADRAGTAPVAVVNEALARLLWPDGSAVGQQIRLGDERSTEPWLTIVGVAENTVHLFSLGIGQMLVTQGRYPALLFRPYDQAGGERRSYLAIAAPGATAADARLLDEQVAAALPAGVRLAELVVPLGAWMAANSTVDRVRVTTQLLTSLALAALLVSLIGVYGLADEMVRSREREIALRRALGASGGSVALLFGSRLARLLAASSIVGATSAASIAVAAERLLYGYGGLEREIRTGLAFGVTGHDPRLYLIAAVSCALMLALGAARPVLRALRIEPAGLLKGVD